MLQFHDILQDTVETIADPDNQLFRLKVDVGDAGRHGATHDNLDDTREGVGFPGGEGTFDDRFNVHDVVDRRDVASHGLLRNRHDSGGLRFGVRDLVVDFPSSPNPEFRGEFKSNGVSLAFELGDNARHFLAVGSLDRHDGFVHVHFIDDHHRFLGDFFGDESDCGVVDVYAGQVDIGDLVALGENLGEGFRLALAHVAE